MTTNEKRLALQYPATRKAMLLACAVGLWTAAPAGDASPWPAEDWETATPAEAGMQQSSLDEARNYALSGGGAGMIARSGKRVYSWGNQGERFVLKSTTKSIGVAALGLALKDGLVSLPDEAQTHLPAVGIPPQSNGATGWLDDITVLHLATHTAGFDKPGGYIDLLFAPGTAWAYSDGGANWLADLLTVRFGADLKNVMFARVFGPLGIKSSDLTWRNHAYRDDTINGIKRREFGSGINADVDAMARIGYLYLRHGAWAGERILPAGFVAAASRPVQDISGLPVTDPGKHAGASEHYGLLWWNNGDGSLTNVPADAFWSWGLKDSLIIVVPSLDLVVARAGNGWRQGWDSDYAVLAPFLEPIVQSVSGVSISQVPVVAISTPVDETTVPGGTSLAFSASAADAEDGNLRPGLDWTSDRDGVIGSGGSFSTSMLSPGTHVITASVKDSGGLAGTANVIVHVGGAGGAGVTLAATADTFSNKGRPGVNFGSKKVLRTHGPNEKKQAFIAFDVSGLNGAVTSAHLELFVKDVLAAGTVQAHRVQTGWSESSLTHNDRPPFDTAPVATRSLTPADEGAVVSLDVTSLVQQWAASPSTAFGIALSADALLHVVFDSREAAHAPTLQVVLNDTGNAAPAVEIEAPADEATFAQGETVNFVGAATDAEEGSLNGSIEWTSDRDGPLGSGRTLSTSSLSVGTHIITAGVTDGAGAYGADSIRIDIGSPGGGSTLTLSANADTFSNRARPAVNYGSRKVTRAHGPNEKKIGFVRFDVSSLNSAITEAVMYLHVKDVLSSGVLDVHAVQESWSESTLTHEDRPAYGPPVASLELTPSDRGSRVSLDVTSAVQEWAALPASAEGFAFTSQNLHAIFETREAAHGPIVEVTQD